MNDPGLDDTVAVEARAIDESQSYGGPQEKEQQLVETQHPHAGRWWLASTAYPLTAVCNIADR